jgi:acetyltransferase-like isoleucine patch superfamily enzyme
MSDEADVTGEPKVKKKNNLSRRMLLFIVPFIVFSLGFIPLIIITRIIMYLYTLFNPHYLLFDILVLPLLAVTGLLILVTSETLISGLFIKIFNIRYEEGVYEYSTSDLNSLRWMLLCQLYTPIRKILEIVPLPGVKRLYLKMLGMRIGCNTLIGGVIKDPCVTEVGSNTTIGEYAVIYAHMHDYSKNTLTVKKIKIGDNCIIGAGAIIMPGVTMEDNSIVGAGAVVPKNYTVKTGNIYIGNPLKEMEQKNRSQDSGFR